MLAQNVPASLENPEQTLALSAEVRSGRAGLLLPEKAARRENQKKPHWERTVCPVRRRQETVERAAGSSPEEMEAGENPENHPGEESRNGARGRLRVRG